LYVPTKKKEKRKKFTRYIEIVFERKNVFVFFGDKYFAKAHKITTVSIKLLQHSKIYGQ